MSDWQNRETQFVAALRNLAPPDEKGDIDPKRVDRRALAILRRGLGKAQEDNAALYQYIYPYEPVPGKQEDDFFLIAALFALHPQIWPQAEVPSARSFGASWRSLRQKREIPETAYSSFDARFVALLDTPRPALPERLRHAVAFLKSHDVPIDWGRLLRDLDGWEDTDKRVQRHWARDYWTPITMASKNNSE